MYQMFQSTYKQNTNLNTILVNSNTTIMIIHNNCDCKLINIKQHVLFMLPECSK